MKITPKILYEILRDTSMAWIDSKAPRLGASLAYYTIFAIAPLFLIALRIASICFGQEAAQHELFGQLQGLLGKAGGEAVESMVKSAAEQPNAGMWATLIAFGTLIIAASAMFVELQDALNTVWKVDRNPGHGLMQFVKDRLLSFAMIVGIGFLLLVSLVVSAALSGLGKFMESGQDYHIIWTGVNFAVSLGMITVLFALIFKILPDVRIAWRNVWAGGFITALLFNFGKFILGFYLGRNSVTSAYGAAGSLVIILLWVYYSAQILFFGAELTRICSIRFGTKLMPSTGAHFQDAPAKIPRHRASATT